MRRITLKWLEGCKSRERACQPAIDWFKTLPASVRGDTVKVIRLAAKEDYWWSCWVIPRLLKQQKSQVRYALYAARTVEHFSNDIHVKAYNDLVAKQLSGGGVSDQELRAAARAIWDADAVDVAARAVWAATIDAVLVAERAACVAAWDGTDATKKAILEHGIKLLREEVRR